MTVLNGYGQAEIGEVVLFCVLVWFSAKPRPRMAVSGLFLLLYGVFRIAVEFVRIPDAINDVPQYIAWDWLTRGQLYSAPMVVAGAILLWLAYRQTHAETARA